MLNRACYRFRKSHCRKLNGPSFLPSFQLLVHAKPTDAPSSGQSSYSGISGPAVALSSAAAILSWKRSLATRDFQHAVSCSLAPSLRCSYIIRSRRLVQSSTDIPNIIFPRFFTSSPRSTKSSLRIEISAQISIFQSRIFSVPKFRTLVRRLRLRPILF